MVRPRFSPLDGPVITFAHRGGAAHGPENALSTFVAALERGASGLESDVWPSADGHAVLDHDGVVGGRLRKRLISTLSRGELPEHLCTLAELYEAVGPNVPLSLDVKDPAAFAPVIDAARHADAEGELWLCSPHLDELTNWRHETSAQLVHSTKMASSKLSPERQLALLRERGVDALNLHHREWSGGLVAMAHRFDLFALGWDAQHEREIAGLIDIGIDGIFSDHVDRMIAVVSQFYSD